MAPRAYNNETRLTQQAELKARIAAAAAELHALKGAVATSYAEIARQAGVSLPTVYAHFPSLDELVQACTAHVGQQAPPFPADEIFAAPDLAAAAQALVDAMDKLHAHFEPWLVWREQRQIAALAALQADERRQQLELIRALLQRHLGPGEHGEAAAAWESLLCFDLWHRLAREHKLSRKAVRKTLLQLLLAVTGPQPAAAPLSSTRPTTTQRK